MISIHSLRVADLSEYVAEECRFLCHRDSEMQSLFDRVPWDLEPHEGEWVVSYAYVNGARGATVIGWASATDWFVGRETRRQVQIYVSKHYRRQGIGSALCACLGRVATKDKGHICVFSPEALRIAARLGWQATQYTHVDDGWIGVATTDGRVIGESNAAGLHAPASEVRDLPLAREQDGEAT